MWVDCRGILAVVLNESALGVFDGCGAAEQACINTEMTNKVNDLFCIGYQILKALMIILSFPPFCFAGGPRFQASAFTSRFNLMRMAVAAHVTIMPPDVPDPHGSFQLDP